MTDTTTASNAQAATGGFPFETAEEFKSFYERFGANGRTFRDFTQLTPESMEAIYMVAYNLYNGAKYGEAEKVFQFLSILNHFDRRFWTGLGACRQQLKKYDEAIKAFGFLSMLDMEEPLPLMLCAKCLIAQGKTQEAIDGLTACILNCGEKPEHAALKQEAEGLQQVLSKAKGTA